MTDPTDAEHRCPRGWADNAWPTPQQLLDYLDQACPTCRLRCASAALHDAERSAICRVRHG